MSDDRVERMPWTPAAVDLGPGVLRRAIRRLDDGLSRSADVQAYDADVTCMLRIARTAATRTVRLSDGVEIRPGDLVLDVHCWNERIPPMSPGGADIAWARKTAGRLKSSLVLLAKAIETNPDLRDTRAVRAGVNFVGAGGSHTSVSRIIERMGFEDVDEGSGTLSRRIHDVCENILIAALVWTHNPAALRKDKFMRERRPVWSSRERVMRLHGPVGSVDRSGSAA